jgi:Ca-activated chloride channel family protein
LNIIEDLSAGGSTAGTNGIQTAYELAEKHFISNGNNRVILATDGDFNIGISSLSGLENFISEKRETGVYLTVLGFGYGNVKDNKLETLALKGNGNYAYIDSINEARKVLVNGIGGTLKTVAKDVKAQVEFNPSKVLKYRLIGYENKKLTDEEWENNITDAGEIGAGHVVTAVYEVYLQNIEGENTLEDNYAKASVRYKQPDATADDQTVYEISKFLNEADIETTMSEDSKFISAVVETSLILRNSQFKGTASYDSVIERIQNLPSVINDEYKSEFLSLVIKLSNH